MLGFGCAEVAGLSKGVIFVATDMIDVAFAFMLGHDLGGVVRGCVVDDEQFHEVVGVYLEKGSEEGVSIVEADWRRSKKSPLLQL